MTISRDFGPRLKNARLNSERANRRSTARELGISDELLAAIESGDRIDSVSPAMIVQFAVLYKDPSLATDYCSGCPIIDYIRGSVSPELLADGDAALTAKFMAASQKYLSDIDALADCRPHRESRDFVLWREQMQILAGRLEAVAAGYKSLIGTFPA